MANVLGTRLDTLAEGSDTRVARAARDSNTLPLVPKKIRHYGELYEVTRVFYNFDHLTYFPVDSY
eukprot:SAG31_NODE_31240_length_370_cov_0.955720_1_plen_64_part_01